MKKRIIALVTMAALAAALCACGSKAPAPAPEPESKTEEASAPASEVPEAEEASEVSEGTTAGGWMNNDDDTKAVLPEDVEVLFNKAMEGYVGMKLEPVAYLGSQVVAGVNHMLLCKGTTVTANPVTEYKVVVVYDGVDGTTEIKSVVDFDYASMLYEEKEDEANSEEMAGGWTVYADQPAVNLPAEAQSAFDKALEGMTGATYEPIALLGTQVVAGVNYAILAKQTLVTAEPVTNIAVVYVYAPVSGDPEVLNIVRLNLADYNE